MTTAYELIDVIMAERGSLGVRNDKGHLVACFSHKLGREALRAVAAANTRTDRTLEHVKSTLVEALFKRPAN